MKTCRTLFVWLLTVSTAFCLVPSSSLRADHHDKQQQYIELIRFEIASEAKRDDMLKLLGEVVVPGLNRAGVKPVGLFTVAPQDEREQDWSIYVVRQFATLADWESLPQKLAADEQLVEAAGEYFALPINDPAYVRAHSTLMKAFEGFPTLKKQQDGERIYELRTYESHNQQKAKLKVEMFNEGEIEIFNNVGMKPIFYGETLAGANLPNLTYMLVYDDMDEHKEVWSKFLAAPQWHQLRDTPRYKDTVSKIHKTFLLPAKGTQL